VSTAKDDAASADSSSAVGADGAAVGEVGSADGLGADAAAVADAAAIDGAAAPDASSQPVPGGVPVGESRVVGDVAPQHAATAADEVPPTEEGAAAAGGETSEADPEVQRHASEPRGIVSPATPRAGDAVSRLPAGGEAKLHRQSATGPEAPEDVSDPEVGDAHDGGETGDDQPAARTATATPRAPDPASVRPGGDLRAASAARDAASRPSGSGATREAGEDAESLASPGQTEDEATGGHTSPASGAPAASAVVDRSPPLTASDSGPRAQTLQASAPSDGRTDAETTARDGGGGQGKEQPPSATADGEQPALPQGARGELPSAAARAERALEAGLERGMVGRLRDDGEMRLRLEPGGLGEIEVRIAVREGGVHAAMASAHEDTRQLLASQRQGLEAALQRYSLRLDSFDVGVGSRGEPSAGGGSGADRQQVFGATRTDAEGAVKGPGGGELLRAPRLHEGVGGVLNVRA
jgi:hypothetical protein